MRQRIDSRETGEYYRPGVGDERTTIFGRGSNLGIRLPSENGGVIQHTRVGYGTGIRGPSIVPYREGRKET